MRRFSAIDREFKDQDGIADRLPPVTRIAAGILILLHGLPFIFKGAGFWGLDQWKYLRGPWVWPVLILGSLLLLPPVSSRLARLLEGLDRFAATERPKRTALLFFLVYLPVASFILWTFRNATHFLGDGYLWANHLMRDIVLREPVSTWMYRGIYRGLSAVRIFGEINPVRSSAITSVAAGLVFFYFVHRTARVLYEKRGDYILVMASLLSCGAVMLFFGYVETYPPVAAGVMAFLYFSLKWFRHGGSIVPAVLALLVTMTLHLSAVALLPGLLFLLHVNAGKGVEQRSLARVLSLAVVAGFAALLLLQAAGAFGGFFNEHFLPLFTAPSRQDVAYPFFSFRALFDNINELLLICPLVVLLPLLLRAGRRQKSIDTGQKGKAKDRKPAPAGDREYERTFLIISALFYFLVFAVFNKVIGTSRDWDLFSPLAFPLVLWIALLIRDVFPDRRSEFTVLVAAVIITHSAPWIVLNTDLVRSEKRFVDLCDNGYWSNRARGYGYSTLGRYNRLTGHTLPAIQYYGRAAAHDPGNWKYNYYIGEMYSGLNKHGAALEHYFKVLEQKGDHFEALYNAGVSYLELGQSSEAEPYFNRALEVEPTSAATMQYVGYIHIVKGRPREAVDIYLRAVELELANPQYHVNLARAFVAYGDIDSARRHIDAARSIDPRVPENLLESLQKEIADLQARR
jgi:tetratricopeptide (TPR) repeat protein